VHCFSEQEGGSLLLEYLAAELKKTYMVAFGHNYQRSFPDISKLRPAENEILLFELYRIYRSLKNNAESFDEFYYWGDMLLNDFDDIDKYLADPSKLFRNVSDLKEIDQQFGAID